MSFSNAPLNENCVMNKFQTVDVLTGVDFQ
jgi:hypothetical protein